MGAFGSKDGSSHSKMVDEIIAAMSGDTFSEVERYNTPDKNSRTLEYDPRSPSSEFERTPIQVTKTPSSDKRILPENLNIYPDDPRSPTSDVPRTPIFLDSRLPSSEIGSTLDHEVKAIDWNVASAEMENDLQGENLKNDPETPKQSTRHSSNEIFIDDDEVLITPELKNSYELKRPKTLFDEPRSRPLFQPLSNVTNSPRTPSQILKKRQGKDVQKALRKSSTDQIFKENQTRYAS